MKKTRLNRPVLLVKTGATIPETREQHGDFEEWFERGLGISALEQVNVHEGELPPHPGAYSGVVITGSAHMVSHRHDWSEQTAAWLAEVVHRGMPVLGVCFGHQLLAHALGGEVGPNPRGRQIGTRRIKILSSASNDPLMGQLPTTFTAQTTHVESVHRLPPGAVRLASSPRDRNHAFRYGDRAWGVQFHPEFGAEVMSGYIRARSGIIRAEGLDPERLARRVSDTPLAHGLLRRFASLVADHSAEPARTATPVPRILKSPLIHGAR